jgi:hypothetical protein
MVARMFAAAGFIAAGWTAAAAQDLSGHYTASTTFANGRTFSTSADIKMTSANTCDISWLDGTKGVCMLEGRTLTVGSVIPRRQLSEAFHQGDGEPQVGVYQVAPDGSIEGVLFDNHAGKGFAREKLTPVR